MVYLGFRIIAPMTRDQAKNAIEKLIERLAEFPLKSDTTEKIDEEITANVNVLLKLYEELSTSSINNKTEHIKQRIEHIEEKINSLVYRLYDLTSSEIKIVEGGSNE